MAVSGWLRPDCEILHREKGTSESYFGSPAFTVRASDATNSVTLSAPSSLSLLKGLFFTCEYSCPWRPEAGIESPGAEVAVNCLTWLLGTTLRSSASPLSHLCSLRLCVRVRALWHAYGGQRTAFSSLFFPFTVGCWDLTQVVRLGSKLLYPSNQSRSGL